jgi:hypothetical protein
METMLRSGAIDIQQAGKEVIYTMKKKAIESYTKFRVEIN